MASRLPPSPPGYPILKNAIHFARDPFAFVEDAVAECGDIYRMELPGIDDVFVFAHPDHFNLTECGSPLSGDIPAIGCVGGIGEGLVSPLAGP